MTDRPTRASVLEFMRFVLLALGLPGVAAAHDFWIQPSTFQAAPGTRISLTLRQGVGMKGDSLPYLASLIREFSRTDRDGKQEIRSVTGNDPAARITLAPGTTLIGYQSNRDFVELRPEKFEAYLRQEGLERVIEQRRLLGERSMPATEYFVRCAKLVVHAGADQPDKVFDRRLGYVLEIIPEASPARLSAGDRLALQLLYRGEPVRDVRVRAFTAGAPEDTVDGRTGDDGRVILALSRPGTWLVKAVHMIRLEDDPKAQWESFWASLHFQID